MEKKKEMLKFVPSEPEIIMQPMSPEEESEDIKQDENAEM